MSRFRVENARFRILKGGKIGLSLSIALLGTVVFSPINLYSADYFTGVQANTTNVQGTGSNSGNSYTIDVQQATNSGSTNDNVLNSSTTSDDIVFKPTSFATSSYTNPTFATLDTDPYAPKPDRFLVNKTTDESLILTLTFDSGSSANNISKDTTSTIFYSANSVANGYVGVSSSNLNPTLNLTPTTGVNYTANIIMSGNNTVAGTTNLGSDGNINIQGKVEFQDSVTAGSIDMDTTDIATFKKDVNLMSNEVLN